MVLYFEESIHIAKQYEFPNYLSLNTKKDKREFLNIFDALQYKLFSKIHIFLTKNIVLDRMIIYIIYMCVYVCVCL